MAPVCPGRRCLFAKILRPVPSSAKRPVSRRATDPGKCSYCARVSNTAPRPTRKRTTPASSRRCRPFALMIRSEACIFGANHLLSISNVERDTLRTHNVNRQRATWQGCACRTLSFPEISTT